jgi:hypothetical protein
MASRANKSRPRASNRIEGERKRRRPTADEMARDSMVPHHGEDEAEKDVTTRYDGGVPAGSKELEVDEEKAGVRYDGTAVSGGAVKAMEAWARQVSAQVLSPDGPARQVEARGGLASGHELGQRRFAESGSVLGYSTVTPSDAATVQWSNGRNHRVASALEQHTDGSARLEVLDQAGVSAPHLRDQLGNRSTLGAAGAARNMPTGTAGDRPGMQAGPAPRPMVAPQPGSHTDASVTPWGNRQLPRGGHNPYAGRVPGSEYTSRAPGE